MESISKSQMKKIFVTARQLRWSSLILHFFLKSQLRKEHISDLTRAEARIFIDDLVKILGEDNGGYRANKKIDDALRAEGMILGCTPAQCDKIRYLMEIAGWTEGRLKDYLEQFGAERLEDLTRTLASNLIEYLKAEIQRKQ